MGDPGLEAAVKSRDIGAVVARVGERLAMPVRRTVSDRRIRVGRLSVYVEPRDVWVGAFIGESAVYVCPLPLLVFKWDRNGRRG